MPIQRHSPVRPARDALGWQSRLLLLFVIPLVGAWVLIRLADLFRLAPSAAIQALALSGLLTFLVLSLRAATPAAALTGGLVTACLSLATPGLHTVLWPLLTLFLLTFAATRFGRNHKQVLGTAEDRHGRTASQVAANLGAAALVTIPLFSSHLMTSAMLAACVAALTEATADTLSSELGQVLGGTPRLITTWRSVPTGTDGGISIAGTLAGAAGAVLIAFVARATLSFDLRFAVITCAAGIFGLFFDSLLGATLERNGYMNNDAVNFCSTVAAAIAAVVLSYL
jgi:uncharacterized protein (TIGR00297 family)